MSEAEDHTPADLASEIDEAAIRAHRRMKVAWVVAAIGIVALAGYLVFAYRKIDRSSRADLIAAYTQTYLANQLPKAGEAFERHLRKNAPQYVDEAGRAVLEGPRVAREAAQGFLLSRARDRLEKLEKQLADTLRAQIETLANEVDAETRAGRRRELKRLLGELAVILRSETIAAIDAKYSKFYEPRAKAAREYLRKLVRGENLTRRQRLQRKLLVSVLALQRKLEKGDAEKPVKLPMPAGLQGGRGS